MEYFTPIPEEFSQDDMANVSMFLFNSLAKRWEETAGAPTEPAEIAAARMGFWKVLGHLAKTVLLEAPGICVSYHMPESKILDQIKRMIEFSQQNAVCVRKRTSTPPYILPHLTPAIALNADLHKPKARETAPTA